MMFRATREVRRAKRAYELARIESLLAENRAQVERLREPDECPMCKAMATETS